MMSSTSYSLIACVGTGFSGIGLGASLQRWYKIQDIQYFERSSQPCGTWNINQYPGCACDVPSVLYSFSYEPNTDWSRVLPTNEEIKQYLLRVARKYDLLSKMRFGVEVLKAEWTPSANRWRLTVKDLASGGELIHECAILFSAVGQLVYPRDLEVPGLENFAGDIFHSARWRKDVTLQGKNVVIFGNGCTAAQIVPSIVKETNTLTQIVRSKHWIFPPVDFKYPKWLRTCFRYIPGLLWLHRLQIFLIAERDFALFPMTKRAAALRAHRRIDVERYMRRTAPAKYHDLLIPDFDIGCKRRIFDSGYLKSLHAQNLTLTDQKAIEIVPEGVRTTEGVIKADVIIMANGFRTNEFVAPMKIIGSDGRSLSEHWSDFGGPEAYNCSVMNGFPNFFMILGPNAATGHTSAIMASENMINYSLRILRPVFNGSAQKVEIKADAEVAYTNKMQKNLRGMVWNSGCNSWYVMSKVEDGSTWNSMSYPYSQAHFWFRSLFPTWQHWQIEASTNREKPNLRLKLLVLIAGILCIVVRSVQQDG